MLPLSAEEKIQIAEETLEMSQRVWDEDVQQNTAADVADAATAVDDDDGMYVSQ